ncbi:MAG: B12-binding domain-containing radical SAM protein, partial [Candidatus Omnitrophica bacterium]|nr:B12-binding domain-containing radical SAM protein [Candidatus Omnitrophota bacterium]
MRSKKTALVLMPLFWPDLPPLGLAMLKGYLSEKKVEVDCLDINNYFYSIAADSLKKDWKKSCNDKLEVKILDLLGEKYPDAFNRMLEKMSGYDVLGFSVYKSNKSTTLKTIEMVKEINCDVRIVAGGPEVTSEYFEKGVGLFAEYGNHGVDHLVVGEGEIPFHDYLRGTHQGSRISCFEEIPFSGDLPVPDFSDMEFSLYPKRKSVSIMFSRGCVRMCRFCAERMMHKKFRTYPVDNVLGQIEFHKGSGIENFIFHDSMLNADLSSFEELLDGIINRFGSVKWEAQIAVRDDMSDSMFVKMKNSGCYHLFVGLESGSDKVLQRMGKGYDTVAAELFMRKLKGSGLSFGISLIIGYPGESEQDFSENLDFIVSRKHLIPKIEQVNPFVMYRGTEMSVGGYDPVDDMEIRGRICYFMDRMKKEKIKFTN